MRFSKSESPSYINEGKGWTRELARKWLAEHGLGNEDCKSDEFRHEFTQRPLTRFVDIESIDTGVSIRLCEKSE